jgi:two-component system, OmpR family, phosphate regulon sensor histidine kinase PhoR
MVLQNLLSNAVKYTPANGSVHVSLRHATRADLAAAKLKTKHAYWFFSVEDSGYGIPATQQPKIFDKLFRADNALTLNVEGTGLGLYIVKEVVKKLGGRVWFTSVESVGTTFSIIMPLHVEGTKQ